MSECTWDWMRRALELAERGRGHVEPNPLVGAVIVRDGVVVGEGWHQRYGGAHAEVNALAQAGSAARGATLYVTLEPCCHHGKTPPCTDALAGAGIQQVVAAMQDPFPEVAGRGIAALEAKGVRVELGLGEREARRLNAPYLKLLASGIPYVHAKWAMTLDGKISTRTGESKWISQEESRRLVHALRGRMDAVVVGIGTALADDPLLTARPPGPRTAMRIVLDSQGRLPADGQLAKTARAFPLALATTPEIDVHRALTLQALGCELIRLPVEAGRPAVGALLAELGRRRMTNVLVEGGSAVLGSFFDAGDIDEVHILLAPRLFGGTAAKTPIGGQGIGRLIDSCALADLEVRTVGSDVYVHGWRKEPKIRDEE